LQSNGKLSQPNGYELETDQVKDGEQVQRARTQSKEGSATSETQPELEKGPLNFLSTVMRAPDPQSVAESSKSSTVDLAKGNAIASLSTRGRALPEPTRSFMESRFNADFSAVRVHTDAHAHDLARSVDAEAFTFGHDVVFGAGQYSPDTESGKRLLAHELKHVLQQAHGVVQLQRQPVDPTQTNSGPSVSTNAQPLPDPDVNEGLLRADSILTFEDIPKVDQKNQTPIENDDAALALVVRVFGGEDELNRAFESLAPVVREQVDADAATDVAAAKKAGNTLDATQAKTANRIRFLARMRLYFSSWNAVLDHFRAIERVSDGPVDIFLHHDAAVHLKRGLATLKAKGRKLPRIAEGFSLRHRYRRLSDKGERLIDHPGMMVHAVGYAFDAFAKGNPRITFWGSQSSGPEKHDLDLQSVTVGEKVSRMNLDVPGRPNQPFITSMGQRTLKNTISAAEDTDPAAIAYFQLFEQQFKQMQQGSVAFTQTLSKAHRDALLKLREDYFAELTAIGAERKKPKPDASVIATHETKRRDLLAKIPALMSEWIAAIDQGIKKEQKEHPGMDKLRSPTAIVADRKLKDLELAQARVKFDAAKAANERAHTALSAASDATRRADARKVAAEREEAAAKSSPRPVSPDSGDWSPTRKTNVDAASKAAHEAAGAAAKAHEELDRATTALGEASAAMIQAGEARDAAEHARRDHNFDTELAQSNKPDLQKSWARIDRLSELRKALTNPDLKSTGGVKAFERLTTGDLSERASDFDPDNPPLIRLLDTGFFNPNGEFDLAFFEEMAHSGFVPGASWSFDWVDSMHFQFVEGVNGLLSPGKK
jgi:hypothetical protein